MHPGIVAAIVAVAIFAITLGISYPLLAFILDQAGKSETFIGLNSAMLALGFLFSAPLITRTAAKMDAVWFAISGALATAFLLGLLYLVNDYMWWFPIRLALGAAVNILFVISETWINQLAPQKHRGRIMGLYVTVISAGFALGPAIVAVAGSHSAIPFAVSIIGTCAAAGVFYWARNYLPEFPDTKTVSIVFFTRTTPVLLVCAGMVALFDQTTLSLMPIYALRLGLDEQLAAIAIGTMIAGNVFSQIPIGIMADMMPRRILIISLILIVITGSLLLPVAGSGVWLWPILFVWGGAGYGIYTVALAELGTKYTGSFLLAGNAAFSFMWGIGGIIGPSSTGTVMDQAGPIGLPLTLALFFVILAVLVILRPLTPTTGHLASSKSS
jgi:MFS family permease